MSFCRQIDVTATTIADGSVTVSTGVAINARVLEIRYDGGLATGGDFAITGKTSGKAIATITNGGTSAITWQPRQVIHPVANTGAGTALTYDGTNEIYEPIWIADEEIEIAVTNGGNVDVGVFSFIVG